MESSSWVGVRVSGSKDGYDDDGSFPPVEEGTPTGPPGFPYSAEFPSLDPSSLTEGAQERLRWARHESDPYAGLPHHDGEATMPVGSPVNLRASFDELGDDSFWWREFSDAFEGVLWVSGPELARVLYLSPGFESVIGRSPLLGMQTRAGWLRWVVDEDQARVAQELDRLVAGGRIDLEYRLQVGDGTARFVHERAFPIWSREGRIQRLAGLIEDVTDRRRRSHERIQRREKLLRRVLDLVPHQIFALDQQGRFLLANEATATSLGKTVKSLTGASIFDLVDDPDREALVRSEMEAVFEHRRELRDVEDRFRDAKGEQRVLSTTKVPLSLAGSQTPAMLAIAVDISEQRRAEDALRRRAFYDLLTGLPNRDLFVERLDHAMARAARRGALGFAVLFMDVDSFKEVNDSLGHLVGDEVLVEVAARLRVCVRPGDTVSRFGGDEFAVLLEQIAGEHDARAVSTRIHEAMREPFELAGERHFLSTSIGIALADGSRREASELLRDADGAMYHAKNKGPGRTQVFSHHIRAVARRQLRLKSEIRSGLDADEFFLEFQPIVDLETGALAGLEALCRWSHPRRGVVPPSEFIPVAERSGLLPELEAFVVRRTCERMREWSSRFDLRPFRVSVNVSSQQLAEPHFVPRLELSLREFDLDPELFVIELTEGSLIENAAGTRATLTRLRALGVKIALDDFGTGFSSLSHLHSFPIDIIKIDRSFVSHLEKDDSRARIVQATVSLGRDLGLTVTAEGVETTIQRDWLAGHGCDYGQGWLFDRALGDEAVLKLLGSNQTWDAPTVTG